MPGEKTTGIGKPLRWNTMTAYPPTEVSTPTSGSWPPELIKSDGVKHQEGSGPLLASSSSSLQRLPFPMFHNLDRRFD